MNKTVCLTYDYELFFGKSGTLHKCILEPTTELIKFFNTKKIKATFFVDVLYYLRLLDSNITKDDARKVEEQIQKLVFNGHRIELHLHPHWMDAVYERPYWVFPDYNRYKLQNLREDEIIRLFNSGVKTLNWIGSGAVKGYKVKAFRAGGLCVLPFSKLKKAFLDNNIMIDSSVAPKIKWSSVGHDVNYTNLNLSDVYRFSDDPTQAKADGLFWEIPLTTYHLSFIDRVKKKFKPRSKWLGGQIYGDGSGMSMKSNFFDRLKDTDIVLSLDYIHCDDIFERIQNKNILVFLSHTKAVNSLSFELTNEMLNSGYMFRTLDELIVDE